MQEKEPQENTAWMAESKPLDDVEADVCFILTEDIYVGPPNDPYAINNRKYQVTVELPKFPRVVPAQARSHECLGHEAELAEHFTRIANLARKHGKMLQEVRHAFWLRLWIWNNAQKAYVSFPWYDSLDEISRFVESAHCDEAGELFWDIDQGWECCMMAAEQRVHILQRNPDEDEVIANISLPRDLLLTKLRECEDRTRRIIGYLHEHCGFDAWTCRGVRDDRPPRAIARWWQFWHRGSAFLHGSRQSKPPPAKLLQPAMNAVVVNGDVLLKAGVFAHRPAAEQEEQEA